MEITDSTLDWTTDRIIHSPQKPDFFDKNYLLPIEFYYIIEQNIVYYVCHTKQSDFISKKDIDVIHHKIQNTLKQKFDKYEICLLKSKSNTNECKENS